MRPRRWFGCADVLLAFLARLQEVVQESDPQGEGVSIVMAGNLLASPRQGTPRVAIDALYALYALYAPKSAVRVP